MAIMVLWCLCAYPHTLLTLTPLFYPLNHIQPLSCNTLFMAKGETWLYCQAMVSDSEILNHILKKSYSGALQDIMYIMHCTWHFVENLTVFVDNHPVLGSIL